VYDMTTTTFDPNSDSNSDSMTLGRTGAPGSPGAAGARARAGASQVVSTLTIAGRTIKKFVRTPQLIVAGTAQGALFLLIFRYVFGGAVAHTGSLRYVDFLVPGFVATSVLFTGMGASAGVADDLGLGLMDRLRSLPISRFSIIDANVWANTALTVLSLAITTGIGFAIGFRIHNGVGPALEAFGMCVVFGFAFCWLFVALGLFAGGPEPVVPGVPLDLRFQRIRPGFDDARVDAGLRQPSAHHRHGQHGAHPDRGPRRRGRAGPLAELLPAGVAGVVRSHRRTGSPPGGHPPAPLRDAAVPGSPSCTAA